MELSNEEQQIADEAQKRGYTLTQNIYGELRISTPKKSHDAYLNMLNRQLFAIQRPELQGDQHAHD